MDNHDSTSSAQSTGSHGEQEQKSISDRKLASNRLNAGRSTGPKTLEGKQKSSRNSYKLGIFAREMFRQTKEDQKEWVQYAEIVTRIYGHYRPEGVMEELLVDKVVTESIRFARILSYERQSLNRKDAFWGDTLSKILRYQTAIHRQLTKAVEQLEDVQAERKAAVATSEPPSEFDGVAIEPCDMPVEPIPGGGAGEAIAAQPLAPESCEVSSGRAEISNSNPQTTENYKTNPNSSSGGGNDGVAHEEPGQTHPLAEMIDRAAGLAAPQEPTNRPVPTSGFGTKSQDAAPQEPSEEDILNCL